jgi:Uma2 family endonuclease
MDRPTFHARYEQMPGIRAELIGGEVHMPSPMKRPHSRTIFVLSRCLGDYMDVTPFTEVHAAGVSVLLGQDSEPQPDLAMFLLPEAGGQISFEEDYPTGAPELIIEVATSPGSIDLHRKRDDYERHGVREYLVFVLQQRRVVWFQRQDASFVEQTLPSDGILRVGVFPGLWLTVEAIFAYDHAQARAVITQGVTRPEHAAFVTLLQQRVNSSPGQGTPPLR